MYIKKGVLLAVALLSLMGSYAQNQDQRLTQLPVHFRAGSSVVDSGYMDNDVTLQRISAACKPDNLQYITQLRIEGNASPEGNITINERLAYERAEAVKQYILKQQPHITPSKIESYGMGVNWSGLRELVEADLLTPNREKILYIIDNVPAMIDYQTKTSRKKSLMDLGVPTWNYMLKNHFPLLRIGASIMVFVDVEAPQQVKESIDSTLCGKPDTQLTQKVEVEVIPETTPVPVVEVAKVFVPRFAIKTNMLLLAGVQSDLEYYGVTPNLAIEYYFARKWSVNVDGAWADFKTADTDTKERYAFSSVGVEARHWFGKSNAFKGLYAGLYGAYSQFNTMDPDKREGLGYSGDLFGGGLSVGYVLPITQRLMLEIGLRGGYRYADYQTYFHHDQPAPSHFEWSEDLTKSGFAIQSVDVSIGYRFGGKK